MNISSIKSKAEELLQNNKSQFIRILLIIMLFNLVTQLFPIDENILTDILSIIIGIVFISISHGYVVSSLKIVRHQENELKDEDAWVGLSRFKELFSTYFLSAIISYGVGILFVIFIFLISLFFITGIIGDMFYAVSQYSVQSVTYTVLQHAPFIILFIFVILIVAVIVVITLQAYLFAAPYLLERFHIHGLEAIKESFKFMKGHVWDYWRLTLSFFGWFILQAIITGLASMIFDFIPLLGNVISAGIGYLFAIYVFYPKYVLSFTIFFEEIAYYRYDQVKDDMKDE